VDTTSGERVPTKIATPSAATVAAPATMRTLADVEYRREGVAGDDTGRGKVGASFVRLSGTVVVVKSADSTSIVDVKSFLNTAGGVGAGVALG